MKKVTTITRPVASQIGEEVREALQKIADRHGLTLTPKRASFDATMYSHKIEFKTADGIAESNEFAADSFSLSKDLIGKTITHKGTRYQIVRFEPSRPKFCIVAKRLPDGREFGFPAVLAKGAK